jgi:hypothetical protein
VATDVVVHVTQHVSWLQTAIPIGSAVASTLAAGASWRAVLLARRSQIDADQPQLYFDIQDSDARLQPGYPRTLTIENVGRGFALFPAYTILSGEGRASNGQVGRSLGPGDKARLGLEFETVQGAVGMVSCEDRRNTIHVWGSERQYRTYKKGERGSLSNRDILDAMYPGSGDDFDKAEWHPAQLLAE